MPCLLLAALFALPAVVQAKGSISKVESEFEQAIREVTPATVVCVPFGVDPRKVPQASSGVIVSRKGFVLSDGDVGLWIDVPDGKQMSQEHVRRSDEIEVRIADANGRGFKSYRATVVRRSRELDTSLMQMEHPPSGLRFLSAGDSDGVQVGDFAFVMGNSFGLAAEAAPTLTAGLIASLVPLEDNTRPGSTAPGGETPANPAAAGETVGEGAAPEAGGGGLWEHLYTSAAVNPGVNGGPLVDVYGRLIGTISSAVLFQAGADGEPELAAYAYMGKVVPIQRIKAYYRDVPDYAEIFDEKDSGSSRRSESAALALVLHHTARKAYRSVVSLEIKRKEPLGLMELAPPANKPVKIARYLGPVSGVLISQDGFVLTSLYNLANISTRVRWWPAPDAAKVRNAVEGIEGVQVYLPDGRAVAGKVVSYHEGLGIALLKADMTAHAFPTPGAPPQGEAAGAGTVTCYELLTPVSEARYESGRFVLALGNPFGARRLDDPLLTAGILSRQHAVDATDPWGGQWQTDAGVTDGNCGGAAVDLHGHLYGILTIWTSTRHGRNSGIGFVIPWTQIEPVLGELKRGRTFRKPFFGIGWTESEAGATTVLSAVDPESAAGKAGLCVGDKIIALDGQAVNTPDDVRTQLLGKWADDEALLRILREDKELEIKVVLGSRE